MYYDEADPKWQDRMCKDWERYLEKMKPVVQTFAKFGIPKPIAYLIMEVNQVNGALHHMFASDDDRPSWES